MANYTDLINAIKAVIKQNGNNEITGQILQNALSSMVNTMGKNKVFVNVASPSTNPGSEDGNVFYLAATAGTYVNFGNIIVTDQCKLLFNTSSGWSGIDAGIPTLKSVNDLGAKIVQLEQDVPYVINKAERTESLLNYLIDDYFESSNKIFTGTTISTGNALSSFSGWGQSVGVCARFNRIYLPLMARGKEITELRLIIRETNHSGAIVADKTVSIYVPNDNKTHGVIVDLDVFVDSQKNLFISYLCNQLVTRVFYSDYMYPYVPANGTTYPNFVYYTNGDLNSVPAVSNSYGREQHFALICGIRAEKPKLASTFIDMLTAENTKGNTLMPFLEKGMYLTGIMDSTISTNKTGNINYLNTTSTFSGWGHFVGAINGDANSISIRLKSRNSAITKVRITLRKDNRTGEIILSQLFEVHIPPQTDRTAYFNIGDVSLNGNYFLTYQCNAAIDRCEPVAIKYPYIPCDDTTYPRHCYWYQSDTDISTGYLVDGTNPYPFDYEIGKAQDLLCPNDKVMAYIAKKIEEQPKYSDVDIILPDKIYAVVGDTLQLFYRGIVRAFNPYSYNILITCSKGNQYPRYYEYTPKLSDIGTTTLKFSIKDNNGNILASKTCTIKTVNASKNPTSKLNIVSVGDSLSSQGIWCREANRRVSETGGIPEGNGFGNISFVGDMKNGNTGYFGVGGWTWSDYTQKGVTAYRFEISNASSLSIGAIYTNNGNTFTVSEINTTAGSGNIRCTVPSLIPNPQESGVLTKQSGDGDSTITYSSVSLDNSNPLWDVANNKMSFIPYANKVAGGKIDAVYTLLSWNAHTAWRSDFTSVINQVKIFANTLHTEFPNAKLKILGIQVPSTTGGMGASYGATGLDYADMYGMVVTALNQNKAYQDFANLPEYSSFVEFVNVSAQFDSEYNMPYEMKAVNTRSSLTEIRGTNGVHPTVDGYKQIGDIVYRNIIANFCQ